MQSKLFLKPRSALELNNYFVKPRSISSIGNPNFPANRAMSMVLSGSVISCSEAASIEYRSANGDLLPIQDNAMGQRFTPPRQVLVIAQNYFIVAWTRGFFKVVACFENLVRKEVHMCPHRSTNRIALTETHMILRILKSGDTRDASANLRCETSCILQRNIEAAGCLLFWISANDDRLCICKTGHSRIPSGVSLQEIGSRSEICKLIITVRICGRKKVSH